MEMDFVDCVDFTESQENQKLKSTGKILSQVGLEPREPFQSCMLPLN